MTSEIIDLATLANLGQHFTTVQESAELSANFTNIENDIEMIKQFLTLKYGSEFSRLFASEKNVKVERKPVAVSSSSSSSSNILSVDAIPVNKKIKGPHQINFTAPTNNSSSKGFQGRFAAVKNTVLASSQQQQQRSKPPPLQRFLPSNENGNVQASMNGGQKNTINTQYTEQQEPTTKKFKSNFLPRANKQLLSKSLKTGGGNGGGSSESSGSLSNGTSGQVIKRFGVRPTSTSNILNTVARAPKSVKFEQGSFSVNDGHGHGVKIEAEENYYELPGEDAYAAVSYPEERDENYEEAGDGSVDQEAYLGDDSSDAYYNSVTPIVYQDEEDIMNEEGDEDNYGDGTLEIDFEGNDMSAVSHSSNAKRADQRRVSLPASATVEDYNCVAKKCKVCHEQVLSYNLFNHVINTHYGGEIPTCHICKKTFTYKQGLISHMRYHDVQKYDKACSYCGKKFIRRSDVIIHERRLHTGERPYHCPAPDCTQGFVRRYCLLTHVKTNHGEPYMSQIMAETANRRKSS